MDVRKACITASVFSSSLTMGILDIFLSPTLIEFADKLNTSVGMINTISCASYVTYLASTFAFGMVFTRWSRYSVVPAILLVVALSMFALPLADNLTSFTIILNILLACHGAYNSAEITWLNDLWKEKAGPYIQAQNVFVSLGHLITPLLFAPFLPSKNPSEAPPKEDTVVETSTVFAPELTSELKEINNTALDSDEAFEQQIIVTSEFLSFPLQIGNSSFLEESNLKTADLSVPFEILGGLIALVALFQFLIYIFFELKPFESVDGKVISAQDEEIVPFNCKTFKRELPLVFCLTLASTGGLAWTFYILDFLPAFSYFSSLHLSETEAANLLGITNLAYSLGAIGGIFLNAKFNPRDIVIGNSIFMGLGNLLLLQSIAQGRQEFIWVSCVLIGAGFSTAVPSISAYGLLHMNFDTVVGSVVLIGSTLLQGIGKGIIGSVIEWFPNCFIYCNLAFVPVVLLSLWGFEYFRRALVQCKSNTTNVKPVNV